MAVKRGEIERQKGKERNLCRSKRSTVFMEEVKMFTY
jgi:hypothetical protein